MKTMRSMAVAVTVLILAGCGSTHSTPAPAPSVITVTDPSGPIPLTGHWSYPDGAGVELNGFRRAVSSADGYPAQTPYLAFRVIVVNDSPDPIGLDALTANCTGADRVFDDGLPSPAGTLLPGQTYVIKVGCALPAAARRVSVAVSPDLDHGDALFSGAVR
jgi:hypothetical protein